MRKVIIGLAGLVLLAAQPAALAEGKQAGGLKTIRVQPLPEEQSMGAALAVRGSAALGFWDGHNLGSGTDASDGGMGWGLGTGSTFVLGRLFGDLGVDYYDVSQTVAEGDEFNRTDLVLTGGGWITDWVSAFAGYRQGWQAQSGMFKDDTWSETGFFTGASLAFPVGRGDLRGGLSLAYNLNKVEFAGGGEDADYNGLSGKVRVSLARTPHAVELRFQNFKASGDTPYFRETYAFVAYVFNWQALTF